MAVASLAAVTSVTQAQAPVNKHPKPTSQRKVKQSAAPSIETQLPGGFLAASSRVSAYGPAGRLQYGVAYSYPTREGWTGVGGDPKATNNFVYTSFRYYIP
ncbi:hypothetical protein FTO74_19075 [Granulicella sp. WH15]|uniref:hypothetical protein n=1 Tax=Granulicella sp. WH15 TaxID=2602070 RepID=UPI0013676573|nr:hypothetical protein [Granulicella sp. WH15]QHN05221.1 hypothetical protein FTO74_19075 [Granulicella sp. WH15]